MDKRFVLVAGGLVAAIAVATLAILAGGPSQDTAAGPKPTPPTLINLGITAADLDNPNAGTPELVEVAEGLQFYSEDQDTVTLFTGDQIIPQPNFVSDVVRPAAEVRSPGNRILRITADAGRFFHPGNEPTRGEFHRNTVVTQYEAPEGETLDLDSDHHVQFRLYLDELTRFDRENGHIQSDGPVHLVGPAFDFVGRGLDLTFNLLDQRVERLVIAEGDALRLAQNSSITGTNQTDRPQTAEPADGDTPAPDRAVQVDPLAQYEGLQPYRVVLQDNLDILVGSDNARLTGDRLEVLFTLAPESNDADHDTPTTPSSAGDTAVVATTPSSIDGDTTLAAATPGSPGNPDTPGSPRSLLTPSPDDVVVKWTGPLELQPVRPQYQPSHPLTDENGYLPAAFFAPPPDQAVLSLHGSPAVLDNPAEDQRISAAVVGYRTETQAVFANGSDAHPLVLDSPELGHLEGRSISLSEANAGGQILGPGRVAADEQGLSVTFTDSLDLAFARHADGSLADLQTATFNGNVHAIVDSDDPSQQLDLTSPALSLTLTPDAEGQNQPSHLQALGSDEQPVLAKQPDTTFRAHSLDVDLGQPHPTQASTDAGDKDNPFEITRVRALGDVRVELLEDGTALQAHALDADPRVGRLALFGENERAFATLTREGAEFAGVHLILEENTQTASALGPGTFSARVDEDDPTARLNIAWSESMSFNNLMGKAYFLGDVRSASTSSTDDTALDAHSLALEFVPQDFDAAAPAAEQPDTPDPPRIGPAALDLRRARALADPDDLDGRVYFTAKEFTEGRPADRPLTRLTLRSRELLFINQPPNLTNQSKIDDNLTIEQVIVPTRGDMLLEDYRTPAPGPAPGSAPGNTPGNGQALGAGPQNTSPINFAGRGVTLFAWKDRMTIDAQENDLTLDNDVYMVHRPEDGGEQIQLHAQRLVADLTETGGLGAFLNQADTAPQAQIRRVNADGRVEVKQGESSVVADHLEYEEAQRTVRLWAEPRRLVELNREDQPNGRTTAKALQWDLDTNEFRAIEPQPGLIPIE